MKEKVILKSVHPEQYGDLVIECEVIQNDKIGEYLERIPEERKFYAYKTGKVAARKGQVGESITTVLTTIVDGKEYVLSEEVGTVKERSYVSKETGQTVIEADYVVTSLDSTSNEQYVVKAERIQDTYDLLERTGEGGIYVPQYDPRMVTLIDENIIIVTAWGSKAVCLKGSYVVTYDASVNDYNVIEQKALKLTYTEDKKGKTKKLKRN